MGYDRNYLDEMNRIQLAMENREIKLPDMTDKNWRRDAKIMIIGDGGSATSTARMVEELRTNPDIIIAKDLEEAIHRLSIALRISADQVRQNLTKLSEEMRRTTMTIENFRIPELNDILITDQTLPRDSKSFGLSKSGVNQRYNFKRK